MFQAIKRLFGAQATTLDMQSAAFAVRTGASLAPDALVELFDAFGWSMGEGVLKDYVDMLHTAEQMDAALMGRALLTQDQMDSGDINGTGRKVYQGQDKVVSHYE